jgi:hypothetical protein
VKYKPVRGVRYEHLRKAGFLHIEANILSKVPTKVPYLKDMINDRKEVYTKAKAEGISYVKYRQRIADIYDKAEWSKYGTMGNKTLMRMDKFAIYKMLRFYQDLWENEHGTFDSPWRHKQRTYQQFTSKFDRTFQQQFYD